MKFIKSYIIQIIVALVFLIIANLIYKSNESISKIEDRTNDRTVAYNNEWNIQADSNNIFYKELPKEIKRDTMSPIILTKELPNTIRKGDAISFYSHHQSIQVFINNELIRSLTAPKNSKSKTPGNAWHFIDLDKDYENQEIRIIITPSYKSVQGEVPDFQYGKSEELIISIIKDDIFSFIVCLIMLLTGIFILMYVITFRKEVDTPIFIIWLGLFSIMLAVWSCADRPIISLVVRNYLMINYINTIGLKLVAIPIIMFVKNTHNIKKSRIVDFLCIASIVDFFVCIILQITGILDFKETLFMTHIIFSLGIIWVVYQTIKLNVGKKQALTKDEKLHMYCVYFVVLTLLMDLFNYYVVKGLDASKFSRIGMLTYALVLVYYTTNNSIKLLKTKVQAEEFIVFAKHDAITKLKNRIAFEEDISEITLGDYIDYGVAVFDLNNLKEFNDLYGHNMGDYYIIIASEIIQDIFGEYGTVYRIGGDEFCAILKNVTSVMFINLEENMNKRIAELNGTFFDKEMSIASGFAKFAPGKDITINTTFQRADHKMYENKKVMKSINSIEIKS